MKKHILTELLFITKCYSVEKDWGVHVAVSGRKRADKVFFKPSTFQTFDDVLIFSPRNKTKCLTARYKKACIRETEPKRSDFHEKLQT